MTSLKEKFKPATRESGIGKSAECPKCSGPAEHYSANYIACKRCDTEPLQKSATEDSLLLDWRSIDWQHTPMAFYRCDLCTVEALYDAGLVARGLGCVAIWQAGRKCNGRLVLVTVNP